MPIKNIHSPKVGFFRFKRLGQDYLLTNDMGNYAYLNPSIFNRLLESKLDAGRQEYNILKEKGFIHDKASLARPALYRAIETYSLKNASLGKGTSLHIVVVTLRCDHLCVYCHASAKNFKLTNLDMNIETARQVVERIFESPNPNIAIEFQGGEPLLNFGTLKFIIEYAQEKNKTINKELLITLVTNLSTMNTECLKYLCKKKISLCTSIDGPEAVHNKNRKVLSGINSYRHTISWFKRAQKQYFGRVIYRPNALTTVTKYSLSYPEEIVNEYIKLGLEGVHLRQLNPFGLARKAWQQIGYSAQEFVDFYKKAFDYILKLNLKGRVFYERTACIFLRKILTDSDPNYFDLRSPCGAGIGQLAYNYNGDVYLCDEGRMLSRMGDESFKIGNVVQNSYNALISSDTVRAVCTASLLDILPQCSICVYKPYCGVCPIYNYSQEGNIFTQMPNNERCKINMAILDYLFEKLKDKKTEKILRKWIDADRRPPAVRMRRGQ
ncbi:MAG: His-Xaa-Ser system radical SAM maturase HxsB [Candidatus Omnitrophica bacterium]|nr:His-Xaa-Ser system radical SAM maturase HxsB [Candidatus Omnitrophota bacterium]